MRKSIQIRRFCPPCLKGIKICAACSVWVCHWGRWPEVGTCAERFLEFEWGVDLIGIFNRTNSACCSSLVDVLSILDIVSITFRSSLSYDIPRYCRCHCGRFP
jgi:hypothetical protein